MTVTTNCFFCKTGIKEMCVFGNYNRKVYEDDVCYAILENEQSVIGYTLVILKEHKDTILDYTITDDEMAKFWRAVQRIGNAIKNVLGAENVYVCSLCDGVSHFHVHLIPRYKWTEADKVRYKELFTKRDGERAVNLATSLSRIGGFWYPADAERNFMETDFMKLSVDERGKVLRALSVKINNILED